MALPDRAANVLPTLVSALADTEGDIIFVGYSMGGLVTQAVLRRAEASAPHDERIASVLRRVRGLVLLGTPNTGSAHATIGASFFGSILVRPRETIRDLTRDQPYLRDLNHWFRSYVQKNKVNVLVIREQKPVGRIGTIVSPSSADPGLGSDVKVIPVDEDHISLSHPTSRNSEVYLHVSEFLRSPLNGPHPDTLFADELENVRGAIEEMQAAHTAANKELLAGQKAVEGALAGNTIENSVVTAEAIRQLERLKKARFGIGFETKEACEQLIRNAENGDLSSASPTVRQSIFAWCARVLATVDLAAAQEALTKAEKTGITEETVIARAFIQAYRPGGDRSAALASLMPLGSPASRTASLMIVSHEMAPEVGLAWQKKAGVDLHQLDSDGKLRVLSLQVGCNDWAAALETATALTEADLAATPALLFSAAGVFLAQAVHPDLRHILQQPLPQQPADFPLHEDAGSKRYRAKAIALYEQAESSFAALQPNHISSISSDRALWLKLLDPATKAEAVEQLQESMADESVRLRRIPLALAFGLELNPLAVEKDIERATALSSGTSIDAAVARFAFALHRKAPEVADYIAEHRAQLVICYQPNYVDFVETEALARAGRIEEARSKYALLAARTDVDPKELQALERAIEEAAGAAPTRAKESEYLAEPTIDGLMALVDALKRSHDYPKLTHYTETLFQELRDVASAEIFVTALLKTDGDARIVTLAEEYPEIVSASGTLGTAVSWAYYRLGKIDKAKSMLATLRAERDVQNDRHLYMNIAIASGDWSSLATFVESEWDHRATREPVELLRAGLLAQRIGMRPRSQELVREAAARANGDATILANAYEIATSAGWENDEDVQGWLATAIERSGEDGPIQRIDIKELIDSQPSWNERLDRTWALLVRGETPIFAAAKIANRTLLDLFLRPALHNLREPDPRKRSLVFAFSGSKPIQHLRGKRLAMDITSMLTLTLTGLLREVIAWSEGVLIGHTTLSWLFEERAKLAFHQPSQVRKANDLKQALDAEQVHRFDGSAASPAIEQEVGNEIAQYLVAAQTIDSENTSQKIVVRPYPLPKAETLMEVEADISGFEDHFAGCADVIDALRRRGQLTDAEKVAAENYLNRHEKPWPHRPTVSDGATLYLDDVALAYFQHLGLLPHLSQAGFTVFVSASELDRAEQLTRFDESGEEAKAAVEDLQATIRDGIASGKVRLGRLLPGDQNDDQSAHPSHLMIAEHPDVDAFCIDDRFVNRHATTDTTPVVTSVDILSTMVEEGAISKGVLNRAVIRLRQLGTVLVPNLDGEITALLAAAPFANSQLQETAELRAIRESMVRLRMTDTLQLPAESVWMDGLMRELFSALRSQWKDTIPDEEARAKSSWVLELLDTRGWAHCATATGVGSLERYRAQIMSLLLLPSATDAARKRYWGWLEDFALEEFRDEYPREYRELLQAVRDVIDDQVDHALLDGVRDE
jgi:PIN domain associated with the TPR-GreAB-C-PIN system